MGWYAKAWKVAPVPTAIGTGVAVIGGGFLLRRLFRGPGPTIPKYKLPRGGKAIPEGWTPDPLAKELYDTMKGISFFTGPKEKAWFKLTVLPTDDMVVAVYNAFNTIPGASKSGTLTTWIRDEFNVSIPSNRGALLARLTEVGVP